MITEPPKIVWNPNFYSAKMTLAKLLTLTWPSYWLWKGPNLAKLLTSQHISISIYICIYVYIHIYAVGSITWPHSSLFWVNNLATVESITWPHSWNPLFYSFVFVLWVRNFQGAVQTYFVEKLCLVKIGVFRKWVVAISWRGWWWWWLLLHDVTRCLRRVFVKNL